MHQAAFLLLQLFNINIEGRDFVAQSVEIAGDGCLLGDIWQGKHDGGEFGKRYRLANTALSAFLDALPRFMGVEPVQELLGIGLGFIQAEHHVHRAEYAQVPIIQTGDGADVDA